MISVETYPQEMTDEEQLMRSEYACLPRITSSGVDRLLLERVLWVNPKHVVSTNVNIEVPLLDNEGRLEHRSVVVGWKCHECGVTIFATTLNELHHKCTEERK